MRTKRIFFALIIFWTSAVLMACNGKLVDELKNEELQDTAAWEDNKNEACMTQENVSVSEELEEPIDAFSNLEINTGNHEDGSEISDTKKRKNPYFFPEGVGQVDYHGFFNPLNFRSFRQDITLHISLLREYEDSALYTLTLDQLNLSGVSDVSEWDYITMGRRYLGYYYVTETEIYMIPVQDIDNGYTDECNQRIIECLEAEPETFCEQYALVCCESGTEDIEDEQGYHCYVEADEDKRIYRYYNENRGGTSYYQKIVWEKNKGIVYYNCGEGGMKMHVEIWVDGYDVSGEPCSMELDSEW